MKLTILSKGCQMVNFCYKSKRGLGNNKTYFFKLFVHITNPIFSFIIVPTSCITLPLLKFAILVRQYFPGMSFSTQ